MKFIKILINSLLCGLFLSFLLALLTLDLNINLPFSFSFLGKLTLFFAIIYGLLMALICIILFSFIQFFSGKKIKLSVISPSFLAVSFSFLIVLFLAVFKTNQDFYRSFFDLETIGLLQTQIITLISLSVIGLLAFLAYYRYRRNALIFWAYLVVLAASMAFTVLQRINYPTSQKPQNIAYLEAKNIDKKITIINLEGLSFDFVIPLINEGKLPNFSWLLEEGSWGQLEIISPSVPIILNRSFNCGKLPSQHRWLSLLKYSLSPFDLEIEVVPRFIFFRQMTRIGLLQSAPNPPSSHIKDIWKILEENMTKYVKKDWPYDTMVEEPQPRSEQIFNRFFEDLRFETDNISNVVKKALFIDAEFEELVTQESRQTQPQIVYFLLNGLNNVEAFFYKYSFPDLFGNIDQEEINKYGTVIERYYQFYDDIIGRYLASLKEDELLVVYSSHGIEPLPLWKRIVEWILGNADISAYHENAPEGVVFFYGKDIVRGKNIEGMRLIDITPTILNYLGLPVGKDMDGIVNSSFFVESFKTENPVLYISSYEEIDIRTLK